MLKAVTRLSRGILTKVKFAVSSRFCSLDRWDWAVVVAVLGYGVVLSYFTILKNYDFTSYAYDLGIFGQAFHTTVFDGKLFFYTVEQYMVPSGVYFGIHFSPILFVLLPIYALYPSPVSLLVSQSFLLALAAVPLYKLSTSILNSKGVGCMISVAYLLFSPLQGANWFDFHPQLFIPLMIFSTYYFWIKRSWKLYFVFVIFSLMIEEHLVYIIFLMALYFLISAMFQSARKEVAYDADVTQISSGNRLKLAFSRIPWFKKPVQASVSFWTILLCFLWYFVTGFVKGLYPINPQFLDIYHAAGAFGVLGFKQDILFLPLFMILNPGNVYSALIFDFPTKLLYIFILFAPLLFFSFRSKTTLITAVVLVPVLLTDYSSYYTLGAQYPLYVIPFVFIAAVEGLSHLSFSSLTRFSKVIIGVSLIFVICTSPLSPVTYSLPTVGSFWYPLPPPQFSPPDYVTSLHALLSYVPPNASILTQNPIFPQVSSRMNAFSIPFDLPMSEAGGLGFMENYVRQLMSNSEYLLMNLRDLDYMGNYTLNETKVYSFNPYAITYSFVLFKKGFSGKPTLVPDLDYEIFSAKEDFSIASGKLVSDASSRSQEVAVSLKGIDEGILTHGPYVTLPAGAYKAVFKLKTNGTLQYATILLDVCSGLGTNILSQTRLNSSEINDGTWLTISLGFSLEELTANIEFRASSNGMTNLYIDTVTLLYS